MIPIRDKSRQIHDVVTGEQLAKWTAWMRAAGRPKTTIALRVYHVHRVMKDLETDPWAVTVEQLVEYFARQSWAPETRRSYRASLRAFYGWAQANGYRADSPAHLLPPIAVPRGLPRPTPDEAYRAALRNADARGRLMVSLAAVCGLRRGEVARLRREDVTPDLFGYSLRVRGKGGHVRSVPLPDALARELVRLPPGYLFPSPNGGHLTPAHVGVIVSRLLPEGWTMHTLRHRCATVAYAAGGRDLRAVQELLGHAKPETTARYTQVPFDAVRAAVTAAAS